MELAIDSSTRYAAVGLSKEGQPVAELAWHSAQNHSVELGPAVRALMTHAGAEMNELDAVFVARGPGGFSALRVGMSLAKALAVAQGIPLVAVNTLDIEVEPYIGLGHPACAILEAGRESLYVGSYGDPANGGTDDGTGYEVMTLDELVSRVTATTVFCGEGVGSVAKFLRSRLAGQALVVDTPSPTRRASVLSRLAYRRWQECGPDDVERLQPLYMRGSQFDVSHRK